MKRFLPLALLLTIFFSCQDVAPQEEASPPAVTVASPFDEAAELAAIMTVIRGETDCFYARDYNCWKQQWVNEDYAFQAWSNSDGTYDAKVGWPAVDQGSGNYIKEHPLEEDQVAQRDVRRKNLQSKFYHGSLAYLIWEQYNEKLDGTAYLKSQETRLMEKIGGDWKIVNVTSFWDYSKPLVEGEL